MDIGKTRKTSPTNSRERKSRRLARTSQASQYWTDDDLAIRWNVSRDTVWRWSKTGKSPAPVKLGDNCTRWKAEEITAWEAERDRMA